MYARCADTVRKVINLLFSPAVHSSRSLFPRYCFFRCWFLGRVLSRVFPSVLQTDAEISVSSPIAAIHFLEFAALRARGSPAECVS